MPAELLIIGGLGTAAALAVTSKSATNRLGANGGSIAGAGALPGATIRDLQQAQSMSIQPTVGNQTKSWAGRMATLGQVSNPGSWPSVWPLQAPPNPSQTGSDAGIDPQLQQKLDTVESYAQAAYNNLDDGARRAGADALNKQLKLDPPLTGTESWQDLSAIAGGAAGAAVGTAILGPAGTALGSIVGAYLGVQIEQLLAKNVGDIENWFKARWAGIENWVSNTYNDVKGAVSKVGDFFDSLV